MDKNQEEEEEEEKLKTRIPKPWVKKTRSFFAKSHSSKKLQKKITTVSKKTPFQQSSTKFSPALHDVGGSFCRSLSSLRIRLEAMWGQSPPPSLSLPHYLLVLLLLLLLLLASRSATDGISTPRPSPRLFSVAKILLPAKLAQAPPQQPHPAFVAARPDAGPFACDPTSLIIGTPAFQIALSKDFWEKKKKKKKKVVLYYIILYCINNFIKYDVSNSGFFYPPSILWY